MGEIEILKQPARMAPEELKNLADEVRAIADDIEKGEILALTWVEHRIYDEFVVTWVRSAGVSNLDLVGGAYALMHKITLGLLNDE